MFSWYLISVRYKYNDIHKQALALIWLEEWKTYIDVPKQCLLWFPISPVVAKSDIVLQKIIFELHTLYINPYRCSFRTSNSICGCTAVWPWFSSLYVGDCVVWSIVKVCIRTVCLEPSPCDADGWVCITHCTHQCSCSSLSHSVWNWWTSSHFRFICTNVLRKSKMYLVIWSKKQNVSSLLGVLVHKQNRRMNKVE